MALGHVRARPEMLLPADRASRTPSPSCAAAAVERLAENLQSHIDFEERNLAPALNALSKVVSEDDVPPPPRDYRVYRAEIDSALIRGAGARRERIGASHGLSRTV